LTISPGLLGELKASTVRIERKLDEVTAKKDPIQKIPNDEKTFRFLLNEDAMATEKLAEGIRLFAGDIVKLEKKIVSKL
jgi:transaldolase